MTTINSDSSSRHDRILLSLFPPPNTAVTTTRQPSNNKRESRHTQHQDQAAAWELVSSWLSVQKQPSRSVGKNAVPLGLDGALSLLLHDRDLSKTLLDWFMNEIQTHLDSVVKSKLRELWSEPVPCSTARENVDQSLDLLQSAQTTVLHKLDSWLSSRHRHEVFQIVTTFRSSALAQMQSIALHSVPIKEFSKALTYVMHESLCSWLLLPSPNEAAAQRKATFDLLSSLYPSGFGEDFGQRIFAQAMNQVIDSFVESSAMKVDWIGKSSVTDRLREWVQQSFVPAVTDGLYSLTGNPNLTVTPNESSDWERAALDRLAKQRMKYLLDYVKFWPSSCGAIEDLKEYIHSSKSKILLVSSFSQQMSRRLLHAGVSTSELLSIYIQMILAFKILDPRGVLLDKVAMPLRSYLRLREDTVRIIAASFLADVDSQGQITSTYDDVCYALAREIDSSDERPHAEEKGLDWDDMQWMPDPMDAGPDYKKSRSEDIISFMLTLFEQGDFIKEMQSLLGERLLSIGTTDTELEKEIRLVELFKTRFGAERLQSCEVMLRDILDSRRINRTLRPLDLSGLPTVEEIHAAVSAGGLSIVDLVDKFRPRIAQTQPAHQRFIDLVKAVTRLDNRKFLHPAQYSPMAESDRSEPHTRFYTQILSSFFWPSLREDEFAVPEPISVLQKSFERDFERIKNLRKLHWLSALGRATVELGLEDRTVKIEGVHTWQASVIYAFQDADDGLPCSKTVEELEETLSMDGLLVRNALAFWVGHRVLSETSPNTYTVLETLPSAEEDEATAAVAGPVAPAQDTAISAVKSQDAVLRDNKAMYEMFIVGMLTNGGAMDAARVTMMMKMVVPGGYAFGEEETKWLLGGLEEDGKVVGSGGTFSIKK